MKLLHGKFITDNGIDIYLLNIYFVQPVNSYNNLTYYLNELDDNVIINFDNYSNVYTLTHNGKKCQIEGYVYGQLLALHENLSEEAKSQSLKAYVASNGIPV